MSTGKINQVGVVKRDDRTTSTEGMGICSVLLMAFSFLMVLITFPFSMFFTINVIQEYERAVKFRMGRVVKGGRPSGPGLIFVLPCAERIVRVDLRTLSFDVPPQEVLTKDSVTIAVDAVVYFRIVDSVRAVVEIEDLHNSTKLLAATTLRNVLGTKTLRQILSDREEISQSIQSALDIGTDPWGCKVEIVEIKDVHLPVSLQRTMAAEAEASREAKAKVIAAEGEMHASQALKEAADIMSQSPSALQLRYLQTLNTISAEKNSTIIFPVPLKLFQAFGTESCCEASK